MRKLVGLFLIVFALAVLAAPAAAVPVTDLTALARYYDSESLMFASFRTDDGFIETLDALIARVSALMPADQQASTTSLRETLDNAFANYPGGGGTFNEIARPWLGDTAAFGIKNLNSLFDSERNNDNDIPFLIAVANRDRAAAVEFFTQAFEVNGRNYQEFTITDEGAYTLFSSGLEFGQPPYLYIDDEVVLFSTGAELFPTGGLSALSLANSEDFTEAFAALPAESYNVGVYINLPAFVDSMMSMMNSMRGMGGSDFAQAAAMFQQLEATYAALGGQAWGFTIADGRSLTIDIAQAADLEAMLAAMPGSTMINTPVDLGFAARIPAGAPAVILSTGLGPALQNALSSAEAQAEMLADSTGADADEIIQALAQIDFAVQGVTGLDLQDEILSWMDGDYALYVTVSPALGDISDVDDIVGLDVLPAQAAFVVETSNPELTAQFVSGIGAALEAFGGDDITVTTEELGGGSAVVLTVPTPNVSYPVEVLFASNDSVLAIGTRGAVTYSLAPDGPSLADDPAFLEAQTYALTGTPGFLYFSGAGLDPLVSVVDVTSPSWNSDAEMLAFLLDLFHSSSITMQINDAAQIVRAVMTLPE